VVATGETNTVRSFIELAFECVGTTIVWSGKGVDEVGACSKTGKELVKIDPKYFRNHPMRSHHRCDPTTHRPSPIARDPPTHHPEEAEEGRACGVHVSVHRADGGGVADR
jgi:hypothetical protein